MPRYSAGKFRLWVGQPVNAAMVTPPASLRAVVIVCILSATGTLMFRVANQLAIGGTVVAPLLESAILVTIYFLLPILIAHTIATNWPISRILISAYAFALSYQAYRYLDGRSGNSDYNGFAMAGVVAALLGVFWWLFCSRRIRTYYTLIVGDDLPPDLGGSPDDPIEQGRAARIFGRFSQAIGPYFEGAVVIIVLTALYFAIKLTG